MSSAAQFRRRRKSASSPFQTRTEFQVVMQGVDALNLHRADQIVALGGGSVIDAAKLMKLKYESPSADLEELAAPVSRHSQARRPISH
jgi:alcohol dehydrogenase class IV